METAVGFDESITIPQRIFLLKAVATQTPLALCVLDAHLRYLYCNPALAAINGLPIEAHLGRTVDEVLPEFYAASKDRILAAVASDTPTLDLVTDGSTPADPGKTHYWRGDWYPVEAPALGRVMVVTCRDITEEVRLEQELQAANAQKDVLLATLAHEMRNPLAPLQNIGHLMKTMDHPLAAKVAAIVERQVGQLTRLADDLMDASRIRAGKLEFRFAPVSLQAILQDARSNTAVLLSAKAQRLELEVPDDEIIVDADEMRLVQLFGNLISNASRYSPNESRIDVLVTRMDDGRVVIHVKDEGQGISPALAAHIFELFAQGDRDEQREAAGLGLGLWLAQQIASAHHGVITVTSEGRNRGSTFSVTLPTVPEARLRARAPRGDFGQVA
ncbi:MAG: ATP-binding protein [Gammaproteobacteria bacterium]